MASKRAERRKGCGKKIRYERQDALDAMWRMRRQGHSWLNVYPCRWCGSWHVGHLPKKYRALRGKQP